MLLLLRRLVFLPFPSLIFFSLCRFYLRLFVIVLGWMGGWRDRWMNSADYFRNELNLPLRRVEKAN